SLYRGFIRYKRSRNLPLVLTPYSGFRGVCLEYAITAVMESSVLGRDSQLPARHALMAWSINSLSATLKPAACPQMDGIIFNSAFAIHRTSAALSSGGKYRSVWHGITTALALIEASAFSWSPFDKICTWVEAPPVLDEELVVRVIT